MTYDERDVLSTIEALAPDLMGATPSVEDLRAIDQFHAGGIEAVDRLVDGLQLGADDVLLDVGAGLGGPARRIAELTGCHVHGIDLSAPYVEAATALSQRCGLEHSVTFAVIDVADLETDRLFDAAVTLHVQMSVEDKASWYAEIARQIRPGGRLGIWEVCRGHGAPPTWPLPWSLDGSDSFLVDPDALRRAVDEAGFTTREWIDETPWVLSWFEEAFSPGQPPPVLPQLLDDGFTRMINFAGALSEGTVSVWRGTFEVPER